MRSHELPASLLERRAIVYVRQSSSAQVQDNLESQRRQYNLTELARSYGFQDVTVIDEDLGRSAGGAMDRPGFRNLVSQICEGQVGGVFCLEASRLARNGREWHHLLELCGLVGARVVDTDGMYDPGAPNDRLLLGLKGTMSEFELTLLRKRMLEAIELKAQRGELRFAVPLGYAWSRETGLAMDADRRVQQAIHMIFSLFERLGSAWQVIGHLWRRKISFPRPTDGHTLKRLTWRTPAYHNIIAVLRNPFYAGAYAYGKSHTETVVVDEHIRKTKRRRAMLEWDVLIRDHHDSYITWEQYEQNQRRLARNAFRKPAGSAKSARGGQSLLVGLLRCRRCGRMLTVHYHGCRIHRYACRSRMRMNAVPPCLSFAGHFPEQAVAAEILVAVQPLAVEAALMAEQEVIKHNGEHRRALELECEQAAYEVKLAARRYEAVDPDNRLVASELEERWNKALSRLKECEARLASREDPDKVPVTRDALLTLASDLNVVWNAPTTDMRTKQRIVRTLIEEIVVDVDEAAEEVILIIHWRGGQHSELRVRKTTRANNKRAPDQADRLIREMSTRWSDAEIATTLNRLGIPTGRGNSWNRARVGHHRRQAGMHPPTSEDEHCLTMLEAAKKLGVTRHIVRALINDGVLPAKQVTADAPWQVNPTDLQLPGVLKAVCGRRTRRGRPCRYSQDNRTLVIPGTCKEGAE